MKGSVVQTLKPGKGKKTMGIMIGIIIVVLVADLLLYIAGNRERTVGKSIAAEEITEFYYTLSSSTNPPQYQRYHFYKDAGRLWFYHEKREGKRWPLTESDITLGGKKELTEEEWDVFVALLEGGRVKKRAETASAGSRGPWMYLYWNGDRSKFQEFSFASPGAQSAFEEFCGELKNQTSHDDLFGEQYGKKGSRSK